MKYKMLVLLIWNVQKEHAETHTGGQDASVHEAQDCFPHSKPHLALWEVTLLQNVVEETMAHIGHKDRLMMSLASIIHCFLFFFFWHIQPKKKKTRDFFRLLYHLLQIYHLTPLPFPIPLSVTHTPVWIGILQTFAALRDYLWQSLKSLTSCSVRGCKEALTILCCN